MLTSSTTHIHAVHAMAGGFPACGAPARSLIACDCHGDASPRWVTCPRCLALRPARCTVPAEGGAL